MTLALGQAVLVRTPIPLGGQEESIAIVTRVVDTDQQEIDVMLMPAGCSASPVTSVYPQDHAFAGAHAWRWPERAA